MKTWFITGAGRGLGKAFTEAALQRGDRVAATARKITDLAALAARFKDTLLPLELDVTDSAAATATVRNAFEHFGKIDVVVNNAGYGLFGAVEEISESELRQQLEVNLFGVLRITQAALPYLRKQGSGHIIQISTIGGVAAFPNLGGYHASKWALEGLSESLAQEIAGFGIKVTLVEPGSYSTDWAGNSGVRAAPLPHYEPLRQAMGARMKNAAANASGNPTAAGAAILKVADAAEPPLRVFFGSLPPILVPQIYAKRLATWAEWSDLANEANG